MHYRQGQDGQLTQGYEYLKINSALNDQMYFV